MSQRRDRAVAYPIEEKMTEEKVSSRKNILFKRQRVIQNQLTGNDYEDSLVFDARLYARKVFQIINKHDSNALLYKILACIDPEKWEEVKAETSLGADSSTYEASSEAWAYYKIRFKSAVADTSAKVSAYIAGMTP